ncbi:MAG: D-alanyl-D-alanine carboxypeptidase family protein [Oscillospiraceae bacterium]
MKNEIFAKTVSTKSIQVGGRSLTNHNKLLWRYEGADGVKTGYTKAAGRILVSSATRDGRQLIAVTIHAPDDWNDHTRLLDYGFSQFETKCLVQTGQCLGTVEVLSGEGGLCGSGGGPGFLLPGGPGRGGGSAVPVGLGLCMRR